MRDDEAGWLGRLREVPVELREDFMNALCVAAEVDTEHAAGERQLLERAARALSVPLPERLAASE